MDSETQGVGLVETAAKTFRVGLRLLVPVAVAVQLAFWLGPFWAGAVELCVPGSSLGPVGRAGAGAAGAAALILLIGWARDRARGPRSSAPVPRGESPLPFPAGLAGSLSEIPLDQICQLLAGAHKTGVLVLDLEGGFAKVYFENGLFVTAHYQDRSGQLAFNAFHRGAEGRFVFQAGPVPPEHPARLTVTQLLLEAARVSDETTRWETIFDEASSVAPRKDPRGAAPRPLEAA